MPCYQCGKQFSAFTPARPCDQCRYTFCSQCLKYRHKITAPTVRTLKLCFKCYDMAINPQRQNVTSVPDPPKILLERLERCSIDPSQYIKGVTITTNKEQRVSNVNTLPTANDDLEDRVKKLMNDLPPRNIPSQEELELRVQNLLGIGSSKDDTSNRFEEICDGEKVSRLINQYVEEAKIDSACGHVDLNPEKESNKDGNDIDSDDDDELPWCFMCEEDATIRCVQCEGLLCDRCLKKSHRKKEFKHHTLVPYKPKKKTND